MGERALVGTPYLADAELRREYERDIAPRTRAALAQGAAAGVSGGRRAGPRRALDLGAGTGAAGEALRAAFGADLEVVARRPGGGAGRGDADLAAALPPVERALRPHRRRAPAGRAVRRSPAGASAWQRARDRVRAWADALLAPGGTIVLVEPALRETSRELLARARPLLALSDCEIVAPCFWTGACPALARERDWCHDAAPVPSSPRVDFSYLVLREAAAGAPADPAVVRIVSDPLPEKGRLKLYGCGATGRHLLVRLDRDRVGRKRRLRSPRARRRRARDQPRRRRPAHRRHHRRARALGQP